MENDTQTGLAPQPGGVLLGNVAYIPPGLEGFYKKAFTYNVTFLNILAGQTVTQSTQINNDSFFVATQQIAAIFDHATGLTNTAPAVAPMLCRIYDSSSGSYMTDQPTPISAQFGTGQQAFVWLYRSNLWFPGGQLTVDLTNNMAAAQDVRLAFVGFKVYQTPDVIQKL